MKFSTLLIILFFSSSLVAQSRITKNQADSLPNTLENQFIKIYTKANRWQDYKMIKMTDFKDFQNRIIDSVKAIKSDVINKQQTIGEQETVILSLNKEITTLKNDLDLSLAKEDNIAVFGMHLKKSTYNIVLWGIILILFAALAFFILKFKNSHILTREAQKNLSDIENEFNQYRKKSIEKEQKLRRQLQDEINKQRGV